ncbi:MAG: hypothetical protein GXP42_04460 [Chloroflexi bacterium]|nr:hypothetical protein [Chloroflexota bacterium]
MNVIVRGALLNVLLILSLLTPSMVAASSAHSSAVGLSDADAPVQKTSSQSPAAANSGLYRTRITVDSPARWARLDAVGVLILERSDDSALVLVDGEQLETLARLRFNPRGSDELNALLQAQGPDKGWLRASMQPLVEQGVSLQAQRQANDELAAQSLDAAQAELRAALRALSPEQQAGIAGSISPDDDGDGLTNTEESWWCTEPMNADTDGDGIDDGEEIQMLKDWMGNRRSGPPGGTPWPSRPFNDATCPDKDRDSIPNLAERWELGLNMDWESTDRDKFDDGQELFGVTYCPGGDLSCGYGDLPRSSDSGYVGATMPSWVKAPGNHPLVAAFPVPEVDVVESSLHVQTVTTVTTDRTITEGTERTYSTAKTEGTSTSVANTKNWNEWVEVSEATSTRISAANINETQSLNWSWKQTGKLVLGTARLTGGALTALAGCGVGAFTSAVTVGLGTPLGAAVCIGSIAAAGAAAYDAGQDFRDAFWPDDVQTLSKNNSYTPTPKRISTPEPANTGTGEGPGVIQNNSYDSESLVSSYSGIQLYLDNQKLINETLYDIRYLLAAPVRTHTETEGRSWGGSQTTTNTQYEEHTITNGEAFSNSESWGNATAVDSAHAADLWFTYKVRNRGDEYAREIANLTFNIYIGDNPNPAYTYFVANDVGGDGKFHNFMPDEEHTYTSARIPLTLEQMKAIDLGGPLRIVVEDFTYGIDELFYQDAANAGVLVAIEDGVDDGDEAIDTYLIPTWGDETVLDVLARYFPHEVDENGMMVAIWTPEHRADTPSWCSEPKSVGIGGQRTLWCKHALSTADWWNIYTDGMGDGSQGFQDTPAAPGSVALFRFNKDADLDGYSDRSESKLGTDPNDPTSFPKPELIAGMHSIRVGDSVTATLSLLNTGLYDAYGVEAVMIAPDDSISITNNTVGGSGRVRAQKQVIVGSRILLQSPLPAAWAQADHAQPAAGGYYTGQEDRTYTFTVACSNPGGCDVGTGTWSLDWDDGAGNSAALNFGAGYASPTLLDVGALGLKLGLRSGRVYNGESFTVEARTPRDTFQYTINREPYTEPVVIVSYNDPRGNHRFLLPAAAMNLSSPADDLASLRGQMLPDVGVEIVTSQAAQAGANSADLVISNPGDVALVDAHVFLEFVNITGTVVSEVAMTTTIEPGPNVVSIDWDTADFTPAYQPDEDYIVMAFWTDYQGNILDTAARPLSSFQDDPRAAFAMAAEDETWDFGAAQQGTLMQRNFELASVGYMDLLTHIGDAPGISVEGPALDSISPGDMGVYTITINTQDLPTGPYSQTIPIRTSDPVAPTKTITIQGEITPMPPDAPGGAVIRPLDYLANIPGDRNQGEWVEFTHDIDPTNAQTLHPVKVYSQDYSTLHGVGKYATDFSQATASYDMFGDGRDGVMPESGNLDYSHGFGTGIINSGTLGTYTVNVTDIAGGYRISPGDVVLLHQTQGVNAGCWELNKAVSDFGGSTGTYQLEKPLKCDYISGGDNHAQILRVPQYSTCNVTGTVTPIYSWNGTTGGIFAVMCSGELNVTGTIDASGQGFRGGNVNGSNGGTGQQGESELGIGTYTPAAHCQEGGDTNRNGAGGGGGNGDNNPSVNARGGGGGGGGNGTVGGRGECSYFHAGGQGGWTLGEPTLHSIFFGGGGGAGGNDNNDTQAGRGGRGGGILLVLAKSVNISGQINANGNAGNDGFSASGGGGGGAGGSILIKTSLLSSSPGAVSATGGAGGVGQINNSDGASGGVGRIRIEYCESLSGTTNPPASTQKLNCYIAEQVESAPYTTTRLNLPKSTAEASDYQVQYGRKYDFGGAGAQTQTIRLPKQVYSTATMDVLVSNTGVASGDLNLAIDLGDDGAVDWSHNQSTIFPATFEDQDFVAALNAYLVSRTDVAWGADIDVPFKLTSNRQAQVLLTDMKLGLQFNQPTGLQAASVDTGADRPLDWMQVIPGDHNQGETYDFIHALGPDPQTLHPVKIYDQIYNEPPLGVGKYASDFGQGTASYDIFGDGQDGDITIDTDLTFNYPQVALSSTANAGETIVSFDGPYTFAPNEEILIIQMQGVGVGQYEFGRIESQVGSSIYLQAPLKHSYTQEGLSRAQIVRVPNFRNVTVSSSGRWRAPIWDGSKGGIIAFKSNGTTVVNGSISVDHSGYIYGNGGTYPGGCCGQQGYQGGNQNGTQYQSNSANGNGGGGGHGDIGGGAPEFPGGGGGGGNGSPGFPGGDGIGKGGAEVGNPDLSVAFLGGGGGGGGGGDDTGETGGRGGRGGGIIFIFAGSLDASHGSISAKGESGVSSGYGDDKPGGGGGAGGSILIIGGSLNVGGAVDASGGTGGSAKQGKGVGGNGGVGRIRIEYCDTLSGSTNPPASTQKLNCYMAEQVESAPYTTTRLTLPESFTGGRVYQIQYGRRYVFANAGQQTLALRLKRQVYSAASLDVLVSGADVASGNLNLCLDFGNDGVCDWTHNASTTFPATLSANGFVDALNNYLLTQNQVAWGEPIDAPVRVQIDRPAQVLLTNMALTPVGAKTRFLRLSAQTYDNVIIGLQFGQSGDAAGPLAFTVDVGADGSVDWFYSGSHSYPAVITSPNLATAFNAYLTGLSGDVDVPIRVVPSPSLSTALHSFSAFPAELPDLSITSTDIVFGAMAAASIRPEAISATEGEIIPVRVTLHNNGLVDSGPLVVSFFASPPGGDEWYIGSAFAPNVPANGSAETGIQWNTLGFRGDVAVRAVIDPFDRVPETLETNNEAAVSVTILTRPDLHVSTITLSDDEPIAGERITVTLPLSNSGQTAAQSSVLALTLRQPDGANITLCEPTAAVASNAETMVTCSWTPSEPGEYRLFAASDRDDAVDESDEGNNLAWRDVHVGLRTPIALDSGGGSDVAYTPERGYGYLDGEANAFCGDAAEESQRSDTDLSVEYQFDDLLPGHFYHLDLTLFECDGAGRIEQVLINDQPVGDPIDLSDGEVHYLSLLLDPALYRSRQIRVTIQASGENAPPNAVVSAIHLYDIDYRYADSGGTNDPQYPYVAPGSDAGQAYGWLDGVAQTVLGALPYQTRRIDIGDSDPADDPDNVLAYRFDELDPTRRYQLRLVFYQTGGSAQQRVLIDNIVTGASVDLNGQQQATLTVSVPPGAYHDDGAIVVGIERTDSNANAFVNEISLEQQTQLILPGIDGVRVSNQADGRTTISWLTDLSTRGEVHYGPTTDLGHIAQDIRSAETRARSHYVTLENLLPNTTYNFMLVSADTIDDNTGAFYQFTTGPTLDLPATSPAFGRVLDVDGATPAAGEIAYVTILDADGQGDSGSSALLSSLINADGFWSVDLGSARTQDLTDYFDFSLETDRIRVEILRDDGCGASAVFTTKHDSPAQDIVLTCPGPLQHSLSAGWTLIAPNLDEDTPVLAEDALQEIAQQGGTAQEIARWHNGAWQSHLINLPFNPFSLELGQGYFLRSDLPAVWQRSGRKPGAPIPVELGAGWNLIGLPRLPRPMKAPDLLADIEAQGGDCSEAARWRFGAWESHPKGYPINAFDLEDDVGYFVKCLDGLIYTPGAGAVQALIIEPPPKPRVISVEQSEHPALQDMLVTNERDVAFTVTWRTDAASVGWLEFGTDPENLDRVAHDDRGEEIVSTLHHVSVTGLAPQTPYYFRIHSGDNVFDDNGQPWQVTTKAVQPPGTPNTVFGKVLYEDESPASGALVRAWLVDKEGEPSEPMSTLVDDFGYWVLNLSVDRCEDWTLRLNALNEDGTEAEADYPACQQDAPPVLYLASRAFDLYLPMLNR